MEHGFTAGPAGEGRPVQIASIVSFRRGSDGGGNRPASRCASCHSHYPSDGWAAGLIDGGPEPLARRHRRHGGPHALSFLRRSSQTLPTRTEGEECRGPKRASHRELNSESRDHNTLGKEVSHNEGVVKRRRKMRHLCRSLYACPTPTHPQGRQQRQTPNKAVRGEAEDLPAAGGQEI